MIAYNLKFDENTSGPQSTPKQIISYTEDYSSKYSETMLGVGINNLDYYKSLWPPSFIGWGVNNLGLTLLAISTKSQGYGVINRHGVTGQIRSHLLKNYIDMISVFIKNQYHYIFSNNTNDTVYQCSDIVNKTIAGFYDCFNKAIDILPNKNQNGSLYYYICMYYKDEKSKINQWNNSKLKNIYKT